MPQNPDFVYPSYIAPLVPDAQINKRTFDSLCDARRVRIIKGIVDIGGNDVLLVIDAEEYLGIPVHIRVQKTITNNSTDTLSSYTTTAVTFKWKGAVIGGSRSGCFEFKKNGTTIYDFRTSGANPTNNFKFPKDIVLNSGDTATVIVTTVSGNDPSGTYESTLVGLEL